jgi:tyrosinase
LIIRKNQQNLTAQEQQSFSSAIAKLVNNGTYGELVAAHGDMQHNMHANNGQPAVNQQRFLPWHRRYLRTLELLLQEYEPNTSIPYWDWANDPVPGWLAPPAKITIPNEKMTTTYLSVVRTAPTGSFPNPQQVQAAMAKQDYTSFATELENLHDAVHGAFGKSTIADIMHAPADPLFFLHHANVDRIWSQWQAIVPDNNPTLSGDDTVLDPFAYSEPDTRSIQAMGYSYQ